MLRRLPLVLLLPGCVPEFATVDEACKDEIRGEKHGSDEADGAFQRFVCYRRVAGVAGGRIDKHVQEAVTNHATYLSDNLEDLEGDWSAEDPSLPGFTGATDWDRLAAAGLDDVTALDTGIWVWVISDFYDPYPAETMPDRIDLWMGDPYFRQVVLQPSFRGAGLAHVGAIWYGTTVYELPPEQHSGSPILYPSDGQTGVPTTWTPAGLYGDEDIVAGQPMGFPFTLTVATSDEEATFGDLVNPFELNLREILLEGPDGALDVKVILPGTALGPLPYTAAVVPLEPLAPSTDYTFTAIVSWAGKEKDVSATFTTAAE